MHACMLIACAQHALGLSAIGNKCPFAGPLLSSAARAPWLPTLPAHMRRVRLSVRPEASATITSSRRPLAMGASASVASLLEVSGT